MNDPSVFQADWRLEFGFSQHNVVTAVLSMQLIDLVGWLAPKDPNSIGMKQT